jgi:hypothetical protein
MGGHFHNLKLLILIDFQADLIKKKKTIIKII